MSVQAAFCNVQEMLVQTGRWGRGAEELTEGALSSQPPHVRGA